MKKILVVYHSRTGFTSTVARQIANACNADLESVKDIRRHCDRKIYIRLALEAAIHSETVIRRVIHAPEDYDIVVIGTPIWCWNIASPVRVYIVSHSHQFKRVAFFCTYGGSGQVKVMHDLEHLTGQTAIATLTLKDDDI